MYIIDITRVDKDVYSDLMIGKDSMNAKDKILKYVIDYCLANLNISVSRELLDQEMDIQLFSLKDFLLKQYDISTVKNIIIESFPANVQEGLYIKFYNANSDEIPYINIMEEDNMQKGKNILTFMINEILIGKYENDLSQYDKAKLNYDSDDIYSITFDKTICEIHSLKEMNKKLDVLLEHPITFKQLNDTDIGGIDI